MFGTILLSRPLIELVCELHKRNGGNFENERPCQSSPCRSHNVFVETRSSVRRVTLQSWGSFRAKRVVCAPDGFVERGICFSQNSRKTTNPRVSPLSLFPVIANVDSFPTLVLFSRP